jgi:polysaccharide biosynthesis protein PslH
VRILYIASRFPYPLEKGDKLRAYYHLRELAAEGHEITLCALNDVAISQEDEAELAKFCKKIYTFRLSRWNFLAQLPAWLFARRPIQIGYFWSARISAQIAKIAAALQPDLVWTQLVRMSEYSRQLQSPKILDIMDTLSANTSRWADAAAWYLRPILRREARLLRRYEREIVADFDASFIISEQDAQLLPFSAAERAELPIFVSPNGVDTRFFDKNAMPQPIDAPNFELVFVGNMGYAPNVAAAQFLCREVMPLIWQAFPQARLLLAGARPHKSVLTLAQDARIVVSGWIDDIRTAYSSSRIMLAPLFIGSGQQNKILEAMALGLACVTTQLVNNAIHAQPNTAIMIADTPQEFAQAALALLRDSQKAEAMGAVAQKFVQQQYDWAAAVRQIFADISTQSAQQK